MKNALTATDWAQAALRAVADHGVEGVAVESLARELGVTKGSFYWHFNNREELLVAALEEWEARQTDEVLAKAGAERWPGQRIRRLIAEVDASRRASRLYLALATATRPPAVRECVARVTARRFAFLVDCYLALGYEAEAARHWARLTFSVYLGSLQIRHDIGDVWPAAASDEFKDYLNFLTDHLVPERASVSVPTDRNTAAVALAGDGHRLSGD